jgi:hypothetical protein
VAACASSSAFSALATTRLWRTSSWLIVLLLAKLYPPSKTTVCYEKPGLVPGFLWAIEKQRDVHSLPFGYAGRLVVSKKLLSGMI